MKKYYLVDMKSGELLGERESESEIGVMYEWYEEMQDEWIKILDNDGGVR